MQSTHKSSVFEKKLFPVVLVLDGVSSPANMGSLFRLGDAFNIEKLIFCGSTVDLESNRLRRTARATIKNVFFEQQEDPEVACRELKNSGYKILALEITSESIPLQNLKLGNSEKVALVLGNENLGIKRALLEMADELLHINMFGINSSMNVTHAAAIALFEITKRLHPVP